jgi:hypothetical protein
VSGSVVLVAPPYIPPVPPLQPGWDRMVVTWVGPEDDAPTWVLSDPASGVFMTRSGIQGLLGDAKFDHKRDRSPAVDGEFYRGTSFGARTGRLNLYVYHDESTVEFVNRIDAFWRSMDPERPGTLTVQIPGVRTRSIQLRLNAPDDDAPDLDPTFFGWVKYGLDVQADLPFWADPMTPYEWRTEEEQDYFATDPDVYYINSGVALANALVRNTGDRPAWVTTVFHGPMSSGTVTIDGSTIEMPFALLEGEWVRVVTDPRATSVTDNTGADRFSDMGELDWKALPPRSETNVDISIVGEDGYVTMEVTSLHRRML